MIVRKINRKAKCIFLVFILCIMALPAYAWELPEEVGNFTLLYGGIEGGDGWCVPYYNYLKNLQKFDMAILQSAWPAKDSGEPGGYEILQGITRANLNALKSHSENENGRTRILGYWGWDYHNNGPFERGLDPDGDPETEDDWYSYRDENGEYHSLLPCSGQYKSCTVNPTREDYQLWFLEEMAAGILKGYAQNEPYDPNNIDMLDGIEIDNSIACKDVNYTWEDIPGSCGATEYLLNELHNRYPGAILIGNIGGSHMPEQQDFVAPLLNAMSVECYATAPPIWWSQMCTQTATTAKFLNFLKLRNKYGTDILLTGRCGSCPPGQQTQVDDAAMCRDAVEFPANYDPNCENPYCGGTCEPIQTGFLPYRPNGLGYSAGPPNTYQLNNCGDINHQ